MQGARIPGTAADRRGAGVQSERIRAKPKTKAALGGPRRAPCQGTRCPRAPSPHRRLLEEWLSSTPRFPRGAAPGLVKELVQTARIWCKQRAAHWDPPEMPGARGGHRLAKGDNCPTQLAPLAKSGAYRASPPPESCVPAPTTHPSPEPPLRRRGPTGQRHLLLGRRGPGLCQAPLRVKGAGAWDGEPRRVRTRREGD